MLARTLLVIAVAACGSKPPEPQRLALKSNDPQPLEINQVAHDPARDAGAVQLATGVAVRRLATNTAGHFQFSSDSKWLAYQGDGGTHVVQLSNLQDRTLRSPGSYFALTPDARWIIQGPQLRRTALDGGEPRSIGGLDVHPLGHFIISPDSKWVAVLAASGELAIAPIEGPVAMRLPVVAPKDTRCHAGAGFVKAFSGDSQWLVYQHGCTTYEAIKLDGSQRHVLDPAMQGIESLAGDLLLGVGTNAFVMRPIAGGAAKTVETPPLFGLSGPKVAADRKSFAFLAADYSLYVVDIATRRIDRVSPPGLRISPFVELTPDGKRVLYPTLGDSGQRCEFRMFDLASRRDHALATLAEGGQCFIKPAGNRRAVIHHWDMRPQGNVREFLLVDLETAALTRLASGDEPGNYEVSPDGRFVAFDGGKPRDLVLISLP